MAISEQTLYNTYNPDGVVTTFAYDFCCFDSAELLVYVDDVLVNSSEYTVTGIGNRSGGNVVFDTAPVAGVAELLIKLVPNLDRDNDYQQNGELLSDTLDDDIDRLYSILQYQQSVQDRTLVFSDITATGMELAGEAADRANNLIGFDVNGDPTLIAPADLTAVTTITAYAETLLDDATSAQARTTLETVKNNREQEGIRYATAGTQPNYTLTTASPAVAAYVTGQRFTAVIHSTGTTGSNTLNVNALGAKNVKQYDADGNKRSGVLVSGQIAIVEYDGTDFVILNPLPIMPLSNVRQTVQGGPASSSTGGPDFFPATAVGLTLTTQNVSSTVPFVVSAAQGFGLGSDRIGQSTSNLSWTLPDATTSYLYVIVASDGSLTTGSTTVAPAFQSGGTAATTNTLHTFDYNRMVMYVGNGVSTSAVWRVFVGEAITSGGNVTGTTMYAYNGKYVSVPFSYAVNSSYTKTHNIGAPCTSFMTYYCDVAEHNFSVGDEIEPRNYLNTSFYGVAISFDKTKSYVTALAGLWANNKNTTTNVLLAPAKWKLKVYAERIF